RRAAQASVHPARRFAVVVRRDLPAQDTGGLPCDPRHRGRRSPDRGGGAAPAAPRSRPSRRRDRRRGARPPHRLRRARMAFAARHAIRRSLQGSAEIRAHALIAGVDCWPLVRDELAGVALLQFPWSARAMDEAAAALAVLQPDIAVTYAEAGGWGRALALEA